jgi:hypothetical protein
VTLSLVGKFCYTPRVMGCRRRHLGSATHQNLTRILTHARKYADWFLGEHNLQLSWAEREAIEGTWSRPRPGLEFTAGRLRLVSRDWKQARTHFSRALSPVEPRFFAGAVIGWVISWIHCDFEAFARIIGVASIKS